MRPRAAANEAHQDPVPVGPCFCPAGASAGSLSRMSHAPENQNRPRHYLHDRGAGFRLIYSPASVYYVNMPLQLDGTPFGTIRIGISTVFLKNELTPRLQHAVLFSTAAILLSLFLSAGISNLALGPLKEISRNLDSVSAGGTEVLAKGEQ